MTDGIVFEKSEQPQQTLLGKIAEALMPADNWLDDETLNEIMEELEE